MHLQTADVLCRPVNTFYMLLSVANVIVSSVAHGGRCMYFPEAVSKRTWEFLWSLLLNDWHSQQGWRTKGKAWMLRLVIWTPYRCLRRLYLLTRHQKTNGRRWWTCDPATRVTLAELAPGRLNRISKFTSNTNS